MLGFRAKLLLRHEAPISSSNSLFLPVESPVRVLYGEFRPDQSIASRAAISE
jgi:hypothetical protein